MEIKCKVLVVEPEERIRSWLARRLRGEGYSARLCTCGEEALAAAGSEPPDLVLLDLSLDDLNGLDVLERVRTRTRAGVIALSGRDAEKVRALDTGADDFVTKPFEIEELLARMRAVQRRAWAGSSSRLVVGDLVIDIPGREATLRAAISPRGIETAASERA